MYKAIGFDYGGVISHSKPVLGGIAEILNLPAPDVKQYYFERDHLANVFGMSYEDLWTKICTELGHADKATRVVDYLHQQHTFNNDENMLRLIDELKIQGYKTGLLSNNTSQNGDLMRAADLDKHFDVFLISAEIGYQKPDIQAFNLLFKELGVLPEETVFVDDSPSSLSQATQIGYHPILFKGFEDFKQELINLKIIDQ
jgi:epoxide hydrolase-like predicted phosphatase